MTKPTLDSKMFNLGDLFSSASKMQFYIPSYQRPYAWTKNETQQLFDDLYEAFELSNSGRDYFLGMLVLVRDPENAFRHEIVDGQQRLITLTVLYSVLFQKAGKDFKESCYERLWEKGDVGKSIDSAPRLFLRQVDQEFFNEYIQKGNIDRLREEAVNAKTDSQKHIIENALQLLSSVETNFHSDLGRLHQFIQFITKNCNLIATVTDDVDSAIRIFSVMNNRGLNLQLSDIFKAELLEKIDNRTERDKYAEKWERIEEKIERENLDSFLSQICTIAHPYSKNFTVLELLRRKVLQGRTSKEVIDKILAPYADAYRHLVDCDYASSTKAEDVNYTLYSLNLNFNEDWIPLAMRGFVEYQSNSEKLLRFLKRLDRLAAYLNATAQNSGQRLQRYQETFKLLKGEKDDNSDEKILEEMDLTPNESNAFYNALDSDIYKMSKDRRKTLLLQIDTLLSDTRVKIDTRKTTIEHVLPQNPAPDSAWRQVWSDEEHEQWVNRLGNLVLLSRSKNSAASNFDFDKKKNEYFKTKSGVTQFCLTVKVLEEKEWTPETVERRQNELLNTICSKWNISHSPTQSLFSENDFFVLKVAGTEATGLYNSGNKHFIVKKGSKISSSADTIDEYSLKLRANLQSLGIIKDGLFTADYEFTSSSAAAKCILGYSVSGPRSWRDTNGNLLQDYQL